MNCQPGRRVGVVVNNSPDYVRRALACLARGEVLVPLRDEDDEQRRTRARVDVIEVAGAGGGWLHEHHEPTLSDELAQISFTSGTEGEPKGVELTHRALADVVERLNSVMEVDDSIREYVGVPVYLSFGFGRCRAIAASGGRAFIPSDGFDPSQIAAMLARGDINAISAVPSLWRVVLANRDLFGAEAERVRWIEIGSQYMSRDEKLALKQLFPRARIAQHYGLTEASRSTFLRIDLTEGERLESVGRPCGETRVELGSDGRIKISGPHLAQALLVEGERRPASDERGWLITQDLGHFDDEGYLYFDGRADDVINCGGVKLAPEALEAQIARSCAVGSQIAVCRVPDSQRGEGLLLVVESAARPTDDELLRALVAAAATAGVQARGASHLRRLERLPRTASGKIQRRLLSERYSSEFREIHPPHVEEAASLGTAVDSLESGTSSGHRAPASGLQGHASEREAQLVAIWESALGVSPIGVHESFFDQGGDSLTALTVLVRMTRAGLDEQLCRRIFQGATIAQIVAEEQGLVPPAGPDQVADEKRASAVEMGLTVNLVRGVLVALVVVAHWSEGAIERLPVDWAALQPWVAPVFGFGTPGFALVFGLGLGFIHFPLSRTNPARVAKMSRLGAYLVLGGVLLKSLMKNLSMVLGGETVSSGAVFDSFYGVLLFYLLALVSVPGLMKFLGQDKPLLRCLLLALVSHGAFLVLRSLLLPFEPEGMLQLVRLMLIAKYSYFNMWSGVLLGVAAGILLAHQSGALSAWRPGRANASAADNPPAEGSPAGKDPPNKSPAGKDPPNESPLVTWITSRPAMDWTAQGAAAFLALGVLGGAVVGALGELFVWPTHMIPAWKWWGYLGVVLALFSLASRCSRALRRLPAPVAQVLKVTAVVGQLALPLYVGHGLVLDAKTVLENLGLPDLLALVFVLGAFFAIVVWMMRRMYRLYYSPAH